MAATTDKPSFFERIRIYYGEVRVELSKVVWPTKEEVKNYTVVVLVSSAIISLILAGWDWFLGSVLEAIFGV